MFEPFIEDLKRECHVINLSSIDYRLLNSMGMDNWFCTKTDDCDDLVNKMWNTLTNGAVGNRMMVQVAQGRTIECTKQAKNVAIFTFKELCEDNRGSTDYMAIAESFNTVIIRGVPVLTMDRRDYLRRFILLIDSLYYNHRNVVIEADAEIDGLFGIQSDTHSKQIFHDEEFAYTRCLSRLHEMQTREYQEKSMLKEHRVVDDNF